MNAVKITVSKNGSELGEYEIDSSQKSSVVVGRGADADIRLDDRAVGRSHALIQFAQAGLSVLKKTEFGKLQVNGSDVVDVALKEGDVISIADYQLRISDNAKKVTTQDEASAASGNEQNVVSAQVAPAGGEGQSDLQQVSAMFDSNHEAAASATGEIQMPSSDSVMESKPGELGDLAMGDGSSDASPTTLPIEQGSSDDRTAMVSVSHLSVHLIFKPGEANVENFEITKEEISIGRGSSCDIIIEDKKASRKHCIVKRIGGSFILKDLGSANGTYVNGIKVSEQELAGEDTIKIGTTEFNFVAKNQDYFAQESQGVFLKESATNADAAIADLGSAEMLPAPDMVMGDLGAAPADLNQYLPDVGAGGLPTPMSQVTPDAVMGGMAMPGQTPSFSSIPGMTPGAAAAPAVASDKKGIARIIEGFKALPTKKKILYIIAALALAYGVEDLLGPAEPTSNKKIQVASNDPKMQAYLKLPKEKRDFIDQTYTLAMDYYSKGKYELAMFECDKVIEILPDGYKDIIDIRAYAEQGKKQLEAQAEEEKRRKAEQERKQTILKLVNEAQEYYSKGMETEAKEVFSRILELDPENPTVAKLKASIEERERARQEEQERRRQIEAMKEAMRGVIAEGKALVAAGKYYEAIEMYGTVKSKGADSDLLRESSELAKAAQKEMDDKRQPLVDAGFRSYDAKDYDAARTSFLDALKIDPRCEECREGMARIRKDVHERAQRIYIEAIISESVSDLAGAKEKYLQCFKASVPEDEYYGRCWRRYHRFTTVDGVDENLVDERGKPLRAPASFLENDEYTKEILEFL
jgi:pSer/pThr/pTyr-binding forkhead associated (FHA) protein/tetratricopeptide (TPR) repeat protein